MRELYDIIYVSGFGASVNYSKEFCETLQQITQMRVLNLSLQHGITLEEEAQRVETHINEINRNPITLIGFSTGCYVCLTLAIKYPNRIRIILCNPAEIVTRLTKETLAVICPDWNKYPYLVSTRLLIKTDKKTEMYWKVVIMIFAIIWFIGTTISNGIISHIYYHIHGKYVNEPRPNELEKLLFTLPFHDVLKTVRECLVKTNYHELFRAYSRTNINTIHILVGKEDFYRHFSNHIAQHFSPVITHATLGDHHFIYHFPIYSAYKISSIIKS